jgi:tRNA U34 5-methylaminomethyl-2-thiouridine-forming methyltransferase MnmC
VDRGRVEIRWQRADYPRNGDSFKAIARELKKNGDRASFSSAAVVRRRIGGVLLRVRQRRAKIGLRLFRGCGRRASATLLTKNEAHRIAVNIAKLPELLRKL